MSQGRAYAANFLYKCSWTYYSDLMYFNVPFTGMNQPFRFFKITGILLHKNARELGLGMQE